MRVSVGTNSRDQSLTSKADSGAHFLPGCRPAVALLCRACSIHHHPTRLLSVLRQLLPDVFLE